jgi:hypothetical protein
MRTVVFCLMFLYSLAKSMAQTRHGPAEVLPETCRMRVPDEAKVVAYGAYRGGVASKWELEGNRGHETREIAIHATPADSAVFLVLTAYDPVIWVINPAAHAQIKGILVMGYHSQAIANLPPNVPWKIITYVDSRAQHTSRASGAIATSADCGHGAYAYEGGQNLEELDRKVTAMTDRRLDAFAGANKATAFPTDATSPSAPVVDKPLALTSIALLDIPSGQPGVAELVRRGVLRPATNADIEAWLAAATKRSPTGHLAPVPRSAIRTHNLYTALKNFRVPAGLYGGHSISVLLAEGITSVTDNGSHNDYYDIATGVACRPDTSGCPTVAKSR